MIMDENLFFREVTKRICGSLNIETAMWDTLEYLENFIPLTGMNLIVAEPGIPAIETLAQISRYKIKKMCPIIPLPPEVRHEFENDWASLNLNDVLIVNKPKMTPATLSVARLLDRTDISTMSMRIKIKDERQFALITYIIGSEQYESEHAQLLSMLHDPFAIAMSNALQHKEVLKLKEMLSDDNRYLHNELLRISGNEIIGKDKGLKKTLDMVRQVAPLDSPVLLLGETGSGKEVIANAIHYLSPRKTGPFIKVNCGAIPETLIDSELFGHEKGAFTGAASQKRGRFERAHNPTSWSKN